MWAAVFQELTCISSAQRSCKDGALASSYDSQHTCKEPISTSGKNRVKYNYSISLAKLCFHHDGNLFIND